MTTPADAVADPPRAARPGRLRRVWGALGPGLVTGASDDDPSGIATYAQAGAQFRFGLLWTALITLPLMMAVQEICDRTALAADLHPAAVLGRACLHTLARSTGCDRSAAELTAELPHLGVAQGEAKVRQVLRGGGPFTEVWRGRRQAGYAAPALLRYLAIQADSDALNPGLAAACVSAVTFLVSPVLLPR